MQTLEHLLVLLTLLGLLGMLMHPLSSLNQGIRTTIMHENQFNIDMKCSQSAERASTHFLSAPARGCWGYPYTYLTHPDPFTIILEGEGHYE